MSQATVRGSMLAYATMLLTTVLVATLGEDTVDNVKVQFGQFQFAQSMIAGVIIIPITVLISAILIPPAFAQIYGANTSGWNSAVVVVFQILFPVLAILAVVYAYIKEIAGASL